MTPLFTIVCASYLGPYKFASHGREQKILRALNSCSDQTFRNFEVRVIADGCEKTMEIIEGARFNFDLTCTLIAKQEMFSGAVRNRGIHDAQGEYILYLDIDDTLGADHLKIISEQLNDKPDWVWFNDYVWKGKKFIERQCNVKKYSYHGTSNICHRKDLNVYWSTSGYAKDDAAFLKTLLKASTNFVKIDTPQYYVCHLPLRYDV